MNKIFVYKSEIFNQEILIVVNTSYDKLKKWIIKNAENNLSNIFKKDIHKNLFETESDGLAYRLVHNNNEYYILKLKTFENKWSSFELLIHEIVHLKQYLFEDRNIKNEDEFEAYFVQSTFSGLKSKLIKELTIYEKRISHRSRKRKILKHKTK